MAKYLKTVGIIEIISSIIGLIFYILASVASNFVLTNTFLFVVYFVAIVFFAPALGIAFYVLGDLVENKSGTAKASNKATKSNKTINNGNINTTNTNLLSKEELSKEEQYVKVHDPEYYEQIKKEYSHDKELFIQYINERYEFLKEIL